MGIQAFTEPMSSRKFKELFSIKCKTFNDFSWMLRILFWNFLSIFRYFRGYSIDRKFKKTDVMEQFWGRIRIQRTKNLRKSIFWSQGLKNVGLCYHMKMKIIYFFFITQCEEKLLNLSYHVFHHIQKFQRKILIILEIILQKLNLIFLIIIQPTWYMALSNWKYFNIQVLRVNLIFLISVSKVLSIGILNSCKVTVLSLCSCVQCKRKT